MELPSYLKRCYRFPSSVEDREGDWCTPSRRRHRKCWGRAFELSVSVDTLLETKGATELFRFLSGDYSAAKDEDTDIEEEDFIPERYDDEESPYAQQDYGFYDICKIIWLSETVFIFAMPLNRHIHCFYKHFDQDACKVYSLQFSDDRRNCYHARVCIVLQPVIPVASASYSVDEIKGMDVILRLVPKITYIKGAEFKAHPQYGRALGTAKGFPASLDALRAFVSDEGTRPVRPVCLQHAGLSLDQWNTVTANCKKNVMFQINYKNEVNEDDPFDCEIARQSDPEGFMESAILNHCPAVIELSSLDHAPADKRQILWSALESATSLEELNVLADMRTKENFLLYTDAISRTRVFQKLKIELEFGSAEPKISPAEWGNFYGSFASHPTLQDVTVSCPAGYHPSWTMPPTTEKDQMLIRLIRQNKLLYKVDIDHRLLRDGNSFYNAVNPVLAINRFRRVAKSIQQEVDPVHRKQLFMRILLRKRVCDRPAFGYLFLHVNFDMLEQCASKSDSEIVCDWQKTMRHLVGLETIMRARGILVATPPPPPPPPPCSGEEKDDEDDITTATWLERKRKRSRLLS